MRGGRTLALALGNGQSILLAFERHNGKARTADRAMPKQIRCRVCKPPRVFTTWSQYMKHRRGAHGAKP